MPTTNCPITHQYLAVGCSRSSLIPKHFYDETYSYKNYIQIWMFDLSNIKTSLSPKTHQLICLIPITDSGAIWSLKWSPSCSSPSAYLAAGTSSGTIYLYKIFSQQPILSSQSSTKICPFYQSSKSIRLLLNEPNNHTQCLAIDWSIHDPNRLVASYSNGFIALFHVNTNAKHLIEIVMNRRREISWLHVFFNFRNPIKRRLFFPFVLFGFHIHQFVISNF
jgi:WD40 repeat protein